jgi:hypothetical protein
MPWDVIDTFDFVADAAKEPAQHDLHLRLRERSHISVFGFQFSVFSFQFSIETAQLKTEN